MMEEILECCATGMIVSKPNNVNNTANCGSFKCSVQKIL